MARDVLSRRLAVGDDVPIIADGGIHRDGAVALALVGGGDTAMLGSAFAGTLETPGDVIQKPALLAETQRAVRVPLVKHLCSSISYGGAGTLSELRELVWDSPERYLIKLSAAGRESYERP